MKKASFRSLLRSALACLLLPAAAAQAYDEQGTSQSSEYFLLRPSGSWLAFGDARQLASVEAACARKAPVYFEAATQPCSCNTRRDSSAWPEHIFVALACGKSVDDEVGLASFAPQRPGQWRQSRPTPEQQQLLRSFLTGKTRIQGSQVALRQLDKTIVQSLGGDKTATLLIPLPPPKRDPESESDCEPAVPQLVFTLAGANVSFKGELYDAPTAYLDLDGDALPELRTGHHCDGTGMSIWRLEQKPELIIDFTGH